MKKLTVLKTIKAVTTAAGLLLGALNLLAQDGPPPLDRAQMEQRRMEELRSALNVKDGAEWKIMAARITKVMEARRAVRSFGGPGGFRGPGGLGGPGMPPPGEGNNAAPPAAQPCGGDPAEFRGPPPGPEGPAGGAFRPKLAPEAEALRKAIDSKAPTSELKARIADLKAARLKNQGELEKAQDELRQLFTTAQEAVAISFGLL